jgi:GNAT superfamily N-acetyltransferase
MTRPKKSRFEIRLATPDDLSPCLALDRSLETQVVWQIQMREEGESRHIAFQTLRLPRAMRVEYPRDETALLTDLNAPEGILVAEAEGIVLGFAQVSVAASDKSAALRNLVVDAPWRRHRVGSALLDQAKGWAGRHGANHITLETTTRSYPAIRFMLDRGLIFCGFNDRYYASQDIAVFFGQNL